MFSPDWTGSEAARRRHGIGEPGCSIGGPIFTEAWRIPANTQVLVKRVTESRWRPHTTTEEWVFDSRHAKSGRSMTFFASGWLLCVRLRYIESVRIDLSNRFAPAVLEAESPSLAKVQDTPPTEEMTKRTGETGISAQLAANSDRRALCAR